MALNIPVRPMKLPKGGKPPVRLMGFDFGPDLFHVLAFNFGDDGGAIGIWREGDEFCARISLDALAEFWKSAKDARCAQEGVPTWQQKAAERAAFERGVSAMRDVAVTVIRARHESGYACEPWTLVEAIRAAKEPTDPCGVAGAPAPEPVGEVVMFGSLAKEVSWRKGKMPPPGTKLYAHPPAGVDSPDGSKA